MDNPHNPSLVMVYLEANSKEELIKKQFLNNNLNGMSFNYAPPMKDGKKWVVWYYADIFKVKRLEDGNNS